MDQRIACGGARGIGRSGEKEAFPESAKAFRLPGGYDPGAEMSRFFFAVFIVAGLFFTFFHRLLRCGSLASLRRKSR
jgi:hypothetical protein